MTDDLLKTRVAEREMLEGYLDWYRAVAAKKLRGLTEEGAARILNPSGLSVLGVVKHLSWAEPLWFRWRFAGEDLEGIEMTGGNNAPSFTLGPNDTIGSVLAAYDDAIEHSRRVVGTALSLDELAFHPSPKWGTPSLRWILIHMIEETARHAGHLDIMREQLDGATGD
jgi:uncharacterized damage-inducible protein DinB